MLQDAKSRGLHNTGFQMLARIGDITFQIVASQRSSLRLSRRTVVQSAAGLTELSGVTASGVGGFQVGVG